MSKKQSVFIFLTLVLSLILGLLAQFVFHNDVVDIICSLIAVGVCIYWLIIERKGKKNE